MTLRSALNVIAETKYRVIENEAHEFETIDVDYLAPIEDFRSARLKVEDRLSRKVKFITVNTCTHKMEIFLV